MNNTPSQLLIQLLTLCAKNDISLNLSKDEEKNKIEMNENTLNIFIFDFEDLKFQNQLTELLNDLKNRFK